MAEKYATGKFVVLTAASSIRDSVGWLDIYRYTEYYLANNVFVDCLVAASENGDANHDGVITIREAFTYARSYMIDLITTIQNDDSNALSTAQFLKKVFKQDDTYYEQVYEILQNEWRTDKADLFTDPQLFPNDSDNLDLPLFGHIK